MARGRDGLRSAWRPRAVSAHTVSSALTAGGAVGAAAHAARRPFDLADGPSGGRPPGDAAVGHKGGRAAPQTSGWSGTPAGAERTQGSTEPRSLASGWWRWSNSIVDVHPDVVGHGPGGFSVRRPGRPQYAGGESRAPTGGSTGRRRSGTHPVRGPDPTLEVPGVDVLDAPPGEAVQHPWRARSRPAAATGLPRLERGTDRRVAR
jgi:hypothetical protein